MVTHSNSRSAFNHTAKFLLNSTPELKQQIQDYVNMPVYNQSLPLINNLQQKQNLCDEQNESGGIS